MRRTINLGIVLLVVAGGASVYAAEATKTAPDAPVYGAVTSDLMNAYIQPRHTKLWLAGKAQNWEYAEYERHNIGGAMDRLAKAIPIYKGQPTADLVAAFVKPQLAELDTAIKAKDEAAFVTAYAVLTTSCNQCHQATNHALVRIKQPDGNPFPDQDFGAASP